MSRDQKAGSVQSLKYERVSREKRPTRISSRAGSYKSQRYAGDRSWRYSTAISALAVEASKTALPADSSMVLQGFST